MRLFSASCIRKISSSLSMAAELGSRFSLWQAPRPEKINVALPRGLHRLPLSLPPFAPSEIEGPSTQPELRLASQPSAAPWQALSTNNIDMSSTESSGAPAEATATPPAPAAEFP